MPSDTYALALEIKLNDMASEALSSITTGIDNTIGKIHELENTLKVMSTNLTAAFGNASAQINKTVAEINIAQQQVGVVAQNVNTQIATHANTNIINSTEEIAKLNEKKDVLQDIAQTELEVQKAAETFNKNNEKALDKALETKEGMLENTQKMNLGERSYHTLAGITRGIMDKVQGFTKKVGAGLLAVFTGGASAAAGAAEAGAAAKGMEVAAGGAAEATGGFGGSISSVIDKFFEFSNVGMAIYGSVLVLIANALDNAAERAEKFRTAMFRATGSMNMMMLRAADLTTKLKITSDEVDEMITSLQKAGASGEVMYDMVETVSILQRSLGVSADTAAQFANRMRVVYNDTRKAQSAMAMLKVAAVEFNLSGEDMTNVMQEATESATTLGTYGSETITKYTEGLVAAAAAAKSLGINTQKATQLVASMKEPLSFVKILGGDVLEMDPAQKMEAVLREIPEIAADYEDMVKELGAGTATLVLKARYDLDPEQLKILQETAKKKQVMAELGISTAEAEKKLEEITSKAQDEMTGVYQEMLKVVDNIKNIFMMAFAPALPFIKIIFQVLNGILSVIAGIIAPISQILMKVFEVFSIGTEINDLFIILRTIFVAIGKVLGVILVVYLSPIIAAVGLIVTGFKIVWNILKPIAVVISEIANELVGGVWDVVMGIFDSISELFKLIDSGAQKIKEFFHIDKENAETLKTIVTWIGRLIGIMAILYFWTKLVAAVTWGWNIAVGAAKLATEAWTVVTNLGTNAQKLAEFWSKLRTGGIWKQILALKASANAQIAETLATSGSGKASILNIIITKAKIYWDTIKNAIMGTSTTLTTANTVATTANTAATTANTVAQQASTVAQTATGGKVSWLTGLWGKLTTKFPILASLGTRLSGVFGSIGGTLAKMFPTFAGWGARLGTMFSGVVSGAGAAAVGILALKAALITATWYVFNKIGTYFGEKIADALYPEKEIAERHKDFLKNSKEMKGHMDEINKMADKRIAALSAEGKLRAKNLEQWGATHVQASIAAKDAASELKMLESMAKAGNKNADMLTRLNELKKEANLAGSKEKQEIKAQEAAGELSLAEMMRISDEKAARGHEETRMPKIEEIPGVKIMEGGPGKSPMTEIKESTKENTSKLQEAVNALNNIADNKKLIRLLEMYLPKIAEDGSENGLSSVANNWI